MAGWVERLPSGRYRARFRGPDGTAVSETFDLKRDANGWLDDQRGDVARGEWVDPRRAKRPFGEWAREWQAAQLHHRVSTAATTSSRLRRILATFEHRPLGAITRSQVQAWVKGLTADGLAPRTVEATYNLFATIMRAAVDDRMIAASPCRKVKLPEVVAETVVVPTAEQLEAIAAGVPDEDEPGKVKGGLPPSYRRIVAVIAGTGMRQGEVRGLTVDRVDWLRRTVRVDRQWQRGGHTPPKRPASVRTIPVGQHTLDVLAAQVAEFPPGPSGLVFRSRTGAPLSRSTLGEAWARAADTANCPHVTPHSGRDFYASLLIRQGLSPRVVAERLGHKDGGVEVLRTYAHLWPDDEDRTRAAVDAVLLGDDPAPQARHDADSSG